MKFVRKATFDEYAEWYLQREVRKGNWCKQDLPLTPEGRLDAFRNRECGKFREWFLKARWTVQRLEHQKELETLMVVAAPFTDKLRKPELRTQDARLLGIVADNAIKNDYLNRDPEACRHLDYYTRFKTRDIELQGGDRLVLISLNGGEKREASNATYYLHDGYGRGLPYMMLLKQGVIPFEPVEVFLAERIGILAAFAGYLWGERNSRTSGG